MKRSRILHCVVVATLAMLLSISCSDRPKDVLSKDEMVSLLVDIHKGESVADLQRATYAGDSMRKVIKQSIFESHGVTAEQVDTSLVWYGNHIEDYLEIYDKVIAELEDELAMESGASAANRRIYAKEDSIDVWPGAKSYRLYGELPVRNIMFELESASDWRPGDNYTLQYKARNQKSGVLRLLSAIYVAYDDGTMEFRSGGSANESLCKLRLVTDTTKMAQRVYGFLSIDVDPKEIVYLDSVALVRTRIQPDSYRQRNGQRSIPKIEPKKAKAAEDSIVD